MAQLGSGIDASGPVPQSLVDIEDAAEASIDAALASGEVPTPITPVTDASVAPVQDVKSPTEPAALPGESPSPLASPESQVATPTTLDLSTLSESARNFLAKYGGDVNKAAEAYWEQARTSSQGSDVVQRVAQLEQLLQQTQQGSTPEELYEAPPDIQRLDSRLLATQQEYDNLSTRYDAVKDKQQENAQEIRSVVAEMAEMDSDVPALQKKLNKLRNDENRLERQAEDMLARAGVLKFDFANLQTIREQAYRTYNLQAAREAEIQERRQSNQNLFRQSFDSSIATAAKSHGIPDNLVDGFKRYAFGEANTYLTASRDHVIDDPGAFVAQRAKDYVDSLNAYAQVRLSNYSQQKAADAGVGTKVGQTTTVAPSQPANRRFQTRQELEEFEESVELKF